MQNPGRLVFNGINGDTGRYLLSPMTPEELARLALGERFDPDRLGELQWRHERDTRPAFRLAEGLDSRDLAQTGWGVVFSHGSDPLVKEALGELLTHRRGQAGPLFQDLTYRPGESKNDFLIRHGSGPGPVDPGKLPYYLLLVGDPEAIPFSFQYDLDVQHSVGRICFDTPEEYALYARSVVMAETGRVALPRRAAFFGARHPGDLATELGSQELVEPLAEWAGRTREGWTVDRELAGQATKRRLAELLGGKDTPALLFTMSHGMGFDNGSPRQLPHQGALLCQDWPGPEEWGQREIPQDFYLAADDVPADASLLGLTAFFFACYGGGTPRLDDFSHDSGERRPIAPRSFVARLPQRLLAHPRGGALAVVGHVERAWGTSFRWGSVPQTTVFESALQQLLTGYPVGSALEYFNERYAELATYLSRDLEDARFGKKINPFQLSDVWTAHNDARGYAIFGDPAVRLPVDGSGVERPALDTGGLPTFVSVPPAVRPSPPVPAGGGAAGAAGRAEEIDFGLRDSLRDARDQLTGALSSFAERLGTLLRTAVDDLTSLEVKTYVSDDLAGVTYEKGSFGGTAKLRALTRLTFDGDALVCVPEEDGEVDQALWAIHVSMVERAQAQRQEMLEATVSAAGGLLNALKGL